MHINVQRLNLVKSNVREVFEKKQLKIFPQIIAVAKTFPFNEIEPLLKIGHLHFGENKIQEAESKWTGIKDKYKSLQLHMLGKLQTNKAKKAVKLFDYIHSLDNEKLAKKINQHEKELDKRVKLFIQVNLAKEEQKSGILLSDLENFYNFCTKELSLNIIGLMCLPPFDSDSSKYFKTLKKSSEKLNLVDLSMGMSSDYEQAMLNGSTYLRLGTLIFGERVA
tara:strand:- start:3303 stop:3968 length:666 start_codon:yes stop_codon:yes gene_type:complete